MIKTGMKFSLSIYTKTAMIKLMTSANNAEIVGFFEYKRRNIMLFSIALILLIGMLMGWLCTKIKLPSLLGMILTGMIIGPHILNLIDNSIMDISADLRKIALIIILTRAGLTLNIADLKKVGRPAILMCFLPAAFEILGMIILAPELLGITILESAIMGAVVGAVSPAVIVPRMIKLIEEGYGTKKGIPQLILAGASVDDVFVIVMFTVFTSMAQGDGVSIMSFVNIPVSIILGVVIGLITGTLIALLFKMYHIRDTVKTLILLCISFILVTCEDKIALPVSFSALIAIMFIGVAIQGKCSDASERLTIKFNKLWVGAEIILFVLVGATVDISYLPAAGLPAVCLIFGVLIFRMTGVLLCLMKTNLTIKERLFCMFSYMPKATVQAAIGGVPLAMGLSCGNIVLTVAVLAILITAPLGAFIIDSTYRRILAKDIF